MTAWDQSTESASRVRATASVARHRQPSRPFQRALQRPGAGPHCFISVHRRRVWAGSVDPPVQTGVAFKTEWSAAAAAKQTFENVGD